VADWVPTIVVAAVGVLLLVVLVLAVLRPVRRFGRARAGLRDELRTGITQLRAIPYGRGKRQSAA
jgi:hypothetical protein